MLKIDIFVAIVLFKLISIAFSCDFTCIYRPNQTPRCFGKAQTCLDLICNTGLPTWIRQDLSSNKTIWSIQDGLTERETYEIVNPNRLRIKNLRSYDSGSNKFIAFNTTKPEDSCYFTVLAYDLDNSEGSFTVHNQTKWINSTENFNIEIKSFNEKVNLTYKYAALPLDYLLLNNSKLNAKKCTSSKPWLNCLESNDTELSLTRCVNSYNFLLSYGFDNDYSNNVTISTKNFSHTINILYPPKVRWNSQEIFYSKLEQEVVLNCDVECGNPNRFTYRWSYANNTNEILYQNDTVNYYVFKLKADSISSEFEILCKVSNSISSESVEQESQTRFILRYKAQTDSETTELITTVQSTTSNVSTTTYSANFTTEGNNTLTFTTETLLNTFDYITDNFTHVSNITTPVTTDKPVLEAWAIVLIVVGSIFLVIIFLLLIILVVVLKRKKERNLKKNDGELKPTNQNVDRNQRQNQINSQLSRNPVYVSSTQSLRGAANSQNQYPITNPITNNRSEINQTKL